MPHCFLRRPRFQDSLIASMSFARTLRQLRKKAKITSYALAMEAQLDPSYVRRLELGKRKKPSRRVVLQLAQALLNSSGDISLNHVDQLLRAADYGPLPHGRISILPYPR
jgi:transcriptional regulator with XRE-family HTH domain